MGSKVTAVKQILRNNALLLFILLGVILGVVIGFSIRHVHPSESTLMWLGLPGQLYIRGLKMLIVPLVVASVITGTASLDPRINGKVSLVSIVYILLTNITGAVIGVILFLIFKTGSSGKTEQEVEDVVTANIRTQDIFADLLRNIIPDNLFEATFRQTQTAYDSKTNVVNVTNTTGIVTQLYQSEMSRQLVKTDGANLIGLILACTLVGIAAASIGKEGKPLIAFFDSTTATIVAMLQWFILVTPVGAISLILVPVASVEDIEMFFRELGVFIGGTTLGLAVQQLCVLPLVNFAVTRTNPYRIYLQITKSWLIAFSTGSTAAAMPEIMRACENDLGMDKRVVKFVVPLSVTISANGSAVFIAHACLFISNLSGISPTAADIVVIWLLTSVSTMAIPSVPSASIVTVVMILTSLNIPVDAIALLLAVEFYLDRLRTTSSVVSDVICVSVTQRLCMNDLLEADKHKHECEMVSLSDDKDIQVENKL